MLLSVVVPIYNAEKYLKVCIDSIINQTFRDFEIILVDDGSEDNSGTICDEYAEGYDFVRVIHQKNSGVIAARKAGVSIACGRYITFVDSDDWIDRAMYEKMLSDAEENEADVIICDMLRETEYGTIDLPNYVQAGFYDKGRLEEEFYPVMVFNFPECAPAVNPSLCNKVIRRELLEKVIFNVDDTIVFGEDALISYPSMLEAERIYVLGEALYHYRQNYASVTNVYDKKLLGKFLLLNDEMRKRFDERSFDDKCQLKGYVACYSLLCIRKELLDSNEAIKERMRLVREYVADERIASATEITMGRIKDWKAKLKMKLVHKNRLYMLYILFFVKDKLLKLKG